MQRYFFCHFPFLGGLSETVLRQKTAFLFETPCKKCGQLESIMSLLGGNPTYMVICGSATVLDQPEQHQNNQTDSETSRNKSDEPKKWAT